MVLHLLLFSVAAPAPPIDDEGVPDDAPFEETVKSFRKPILIEQVGGSSSSGSAPAVPPLQAGVEDPLPRPPPEVEGGQQRVFRVARSVS